MLPVDAQKYCQMQIQLPEGIFLFSVKYPLLEVAADGVGLY